MSNENTFKVGDAVEFIGDKGMVINLIIGKGWTGKILDILEITDKKIVAIIKWNANEIPPHNQGFVKCLTELVFYTYYTSALKVISGDNNKPDYMAITRLIVRS